MKRIIALLLVLVMMIGLTACDSNKSKNVTMQIASITSAKSDSYEYICESMFADLIKEYSDGTVNAEYYPASQLGSSTELVEAVGLGTVQSTLGICYDIYANIEPMCMLSCMPYLFKDYEHFKAFLETEGSVNEKVNAALAESSDILVLGYIYRAARVTITKDKGIAKPDDFKGMVIRSPESTVNVKWLESMGAMPVTITWSELFTSLSQGAAAGAENSITTIVDSNLQDVVDFCAETNHMMAVNMLTVNKTWFESLSDEQQEAIQKAADEVTAYSWTAFQEAINNAWTAFEDAGATCIRSEDIAFEEFQAKSADVYKYFVKEGYFTEEDYLTALNMAY